MDYVKAGIQIRKKRVELGLTQEVLAEKIDISPSFFSHIENGSRKAGLSTFIKIADTLNVSLDYIFNDSMNIDNDVYLVRIVELTKKMTEKEKIFILNVIKELVKLKNNNE